MPHLIIEYAEDAIAADQVDALVDAVFEAASASGLFDTTNIKSRAIPVRQYRLGASGNGFIHVQCRIHAGRSVTQKQQLSASVLAAVRATGVAVAISTVEIVEMERASYAKHLA